MKKIILFAVVLFVATACNQTANAPTQVKNTQSQSGDPNLQTYSSDTLGVGFDYYTYDGLGPSEPINVKEDGNFILLYDTNQPIFDHSGNLPEFTQVFTKAPNQSLSDAVSLTLKLKKYPKCMLTADSEKSIVSLQTKSANDASQCPDVIYQGYNFWNYSMGWFQENAKTHDRYYFVPQYQDAFQAGPPLEPSDINAQSHPWTETIRFK